MGGGQPVAHLHAVPLLHLRQRAHQSGVGRIQGHDPFFLQHTNRGFIRATCKRITPHDPLYRVTVLLLLPDSRTLTLPRQMERLCLFLRAGQARPPRSPGRLSVLFLFFLSAQQDLSLLSLGTLGHHVKMTSSVTLGLCNTGVKVPGCIRCFWLKLKCGNWNAKKEAPEVSFHRGDVHVLYGLLGPGQGASVTCAEKSHCASS